MVEDKPDGTKLCEVEVDDIFEWISENWIITLNEIRLTMYVKYKKSLNLYIVGR